MSHMMLDDDGDVYFRERFHFTNPFLAESTMSTFYCRYSRDVLIFAQQYRAENSLVRFILADLCNH